MPDGHKNFAASTVATAPSPALGGTSLVLDAGGGALMPAAPFNVTVWPAGAGPTAANAEIVRVTAVATDTLTIVRAQEGSTARSIVAGDQVAATITAKTLTDVESTSGVTSVAGRTGAVIVYDTDVVSTFSGTAPTFVAAAITPAGGTFAGSSVSVNIPSHVSQDLLVMAIESAVSDATVAGWTLAATQGLLKVFYKLGNGSETTATVTQTYNDLAVVVVAYRNAVRVATGAGASTLTAPATDLGTEILALRVSGSAGGTATASPAGTTQRAASTANPYWSTGCNVVLADEAAAVGALPARTFTGGGSGPASLTLGVYGATAPVAPQIKDEGVSLTPRANLDFVGAGVTATDDASGLRTVVTIPGAGVTSVAGKTGAVTIFDTDVQTTPTAPTLVGATQGFGDGVNSLTLTLPTNAVGDLIIVAARGNGIGINAFPAGWTNLDASGSMRVAYIISTGAMASVVITPASNTRVSAVAVTYSSTVGLASASLLGSTGATTTAVDGGAESLIVYAAQNSAGVAPTAATGTTQRQAFGGTGGGIGLFDQPQVAGVIPARTFGADSVSEIALYNKAAAVYAAPSWTTASVTITQGSALTPVANTLEYVILGKIAWVKGTAHPQSGQVGTAGQSIIIGLPAALTMAAGPDGGFGAHDPIGSGTWMNEGTEHTQVQWNAATATTIACRRYNDYQNAGILPAYSLNGTEGDTMTFNLVLHLA